MLSHGIPDCAEGKGKVWSASDQPDPLETRRPIQREYYGTRRDGRPQESQFDEGDALPWRANPYMGQEKNIRELMELCISVDNKGLDLSTMSLAQLCHTTILEAFKQGGRDSKRPRGG